MAGNIASRFQLHQVLHVLHCICMTKRNGREYKAVCMNCFPIPIPQNCFQQIDDFRKSNIFFGVLCFLVLLITWIDQLPVSISRITLFGLQSNIFH